MRFAGRAKFFPWALSLSQAPQYSANHMSQWLHMRSVVRYIHGEWLGLEAGLVSGVRFYLKFTDFTVRYLHEYDRRHEV